MSISLPKVNPVKEIIFYSPNLTKARLIGDTKNIGYFVQRGGKKSFEYSLYKKSRSFDTKFVFNSSETEANVIATGSKKVDAFAIGGLLEESIFQKTLLKSL
jgi:intein/homing endonuclease